MKKIILVLICVILLIPSISVFATNNPDVIDNAGIFNESEIARLKSEIAAAKAKIIEMRPDKDFDIVILTVKSLEGKNDADFADDYYDYNGYADHGILLLYAVEENIIYISTKGNGEYTTYYEDQMRNFSRKTGDCIRRGDYAEGCLNFIEIVESDMIEYYTDYDGTDFVQGDDYHFPKPVKHFNDKIISHLIVGLLIGFIVALIVVSSMKAKLNSVRYNDYATPYVKLDTLNITNSAEIFMYSSVTKTLRETSSSAGRSSSGGGHRSSSGSHHGGGRI